MQPLSAVRVMCRLETRDAELNQRLQGMPALAVAQMTMQIGYIDLLQFSSEP